ncbi:bifunctional 4-hydroxy-2-oxoglutarate aldolase/2-dehydro-3-deoxy-phosphogluconate aldolase [Jannaschia seohaensis]|uniref:2-dehydro-3-deoxyphosphogluconate aldolase / (4S)-4-hydroxy-2-oxoglutarate aldolase n=1 Tax=Jannaschia seohaensis TaxID=475081 RepID=A0A2Y9B1J4_9RHOB|nr:bifunctional 4-hydroxy-2-oxoglutarate aldolase/2-dehydro-3-deoxy-phosphogluconate aldolase [Jannaschia seohaensis]PWJ13867.1 2-dehydro-3-deoxyphosphogluconate aldolase/(4S)-4-hydroxy-2-oxoglutarate aldolase [Jannaschia seohaensis]SSA50380.1 2-dehydro-3-deoxyphosphogluconate aldolase / (4S)-4-hydroxy-2-oxoglutarate aldolase [Jannaschia seohaensis]
MQAADLIEVLQTVRVVPVIDPKSQADCLLAVDALVAGGATAIEITLRSDIAYDTFRAVRAAHPGIVLGAGSVMDSQTYEKAVSLGADFTISPGRCLTLEAYVAGKPVAHVPGVVTPTEIIAARQAGQTLLKFYPSEAAGGASALKDLGRIFPDVLMMPSGGIKEPMMPDYAALPGVLSVGGSWMYAEGGKHRPAPDVSKVMARSITAMRGAAQT